MHDANEKKAREIIERFPQPPGEVVLLTEVGSTMHGISVGSDDLDVIGLVIERPEYLIGLKHWETTVHRTKPKGVRSGPGDIDLTYHSLRKFMRLAVKGNPTVLQTFWILHPDKKNDADPVLECDWDLHDEFVELGPKLISKRAGRAYLGYLGSQLSRLIGERGQKDVKRPELVKAYGYDTKYAAHAVRLGLQGCELLVTGKITLPISKNRQALIDIRNGRFSFEFVVHWIEELQSELEVLAESPDVPDEPNQDVVDARLMGWYRRSWDWE